ncbi:MAG: M28 family peptidase [Clostridia bacterium]|nr:M28 family peptidase [Clostridia bacterium]
MNQKQLKKIFNDTAYVHTGGSEQELKCANYLIDTLASWGLQASLQPFEVQRANVHSATLTVDGKSLPCKGYSLCGSGKVEGEIYYLPHNDKHALSKCKGKIVVLDGFVGYWKYNDVVDNGAIGIISYDGNANYADCDVDARELRPHVSNGRKILAVNVNAKTAINIVQNGKYATIEVEQDEFVCNSHNVVLDIPGKLDKTILLTAHYDTTPLSVGSYDNMTGSVALLDIAKTFAGTTPNHSLRFVWCGSEERGLLGSKAYCKLCEDQLPSHVLNVNVDMIGSIMGHFVACCSAEDALVSYVKYMADEMGFSLRSYQDVYSSDSTPLADKGVPAVSFARLAPTNTATIHNRYDTVKVLDMKRLQDDIAFVTAFVARMANAERCPVERDIPDAVKDKLDKYLCRKR